MTPSRRERAPKASDAELLARVARGDISALGEVYDAHAPEVARFARLRVDAGDVDDVVQETFLRVARIAGTFDGRSPDARSWIFGVAVAIVRERRRALGRFVNAVARLVHRSPTSASASTGDAVDVERALATISESKRDVLLLAEVHGFSGEEIARMLEIPVGTVWTRLHHARRELREKLGGGT